MEVAGGLLFVASNSTHGTLTTTPEGRWPGDRGAAVKAAPLASRAGGVAERIA